MLGKIDFQWPAAAMYIVTAASLTFLVSTGKLHVEAMMALVTWLAPSPYDRGGKDAKALPPPTSAE